MFGQQSAIFSESTNLSFVSVDSLKIYLWSGGKVTKQIVEKVEKKILWLMASMFFLTYFRECTALAKTFFYAAETYFFV